MRFRYSIRDGLLVTAIAAVAAGWWVDRQRLQHEHDSTRVALQAELQAARDELKRSPWNAYLWKSAAVRLAKAMRQEGWYVRFSADGSGVGFTHPGNFEGNPQKAEEMNRANPLPIP
jgi:hypothetical protein